MIKIGVVGTRNIGANHIRNAQKLEGVSVAAVADADRSRLEECGEKYGIQKLYTDANELFEDPEIDGVVLAVPNHLHAPMSIAAMERGKHVLVEKPIAENSENARKMIDVRDKTGKILMVGMNQRFSSVKAWAKRKIAEGTIGDITYARAYWNRPSIDFAAFGRGPWQYSKKHSGGGPLVDLGVHKIDLVLYLLGFPKIKSVFACANQFIGKDLAKDYGIEYEIEDFITGLISFENGSALHVESSFFLSETDNIDEATIYGTKGKYDKTGLYVKDAAAEKDLQSKVQFAKGVLSKVPPEALSSANSTVEHFCNVIAGKEPLIARAEEGLILLKIMEGLYQSIESGEAVKID